MKNKKLLFILPLLLFGVFLVVLGMRLGKPTDITTSTALNKPLPKFSLPLLSNPNRTMTNSDLPKRAFILNVWGSWCPTCYIEHPFLVKLHEQGVPMVGVSYKDEPSAALAYLNEHKDPFVYSLQDYQGDFALDLGLMGAPESFIVSADGKVWLHIIGEVHEKNWQENIAPCMQALDNQALDDMARKAACRAPTGAL